MFRSFAKECESILLEVLDKIRPLDRHVSDLGGYGFEQRPFHWNSLVLLAISEDHFAQGILQHRPAFLNRGAFGDDIRPLDDLAHIARVDLCVPSCVDYCHVSIIAAQANIANNQRRDYSGLRLLGVPRFFSKEASGGSERPL